MNHRGISPIISISLFLFIAVISVVSYQNWFSTQQASLFSEVQENRANQLKTNTIKGISNGEVYLSSNPQTEILKVTVNDIECSFSGSPSTSLDIDSCLKDANSDVININIFTNEGVVSTSVQISDEKLKNISLYSLSGDTDSYFITTWNTSNLGVTSSNQIKLPLRGSPTDFIVDWGDGNVEKITSSFSVIHTYLTPGVYNVTIEGISGGFGFSTISLDDRYKLLDIVQWGDIFLGDGGYHFEDATNLQISAIDAPNLSGMTNLDYMFAGTTRFNSDINHWDVSTITSMRNMFADATNFNQPLNNWDMIGVTNINSMFAGATSFNRPLSDWNTSTIINMDQTFLGATGFNQNLNIIDPKTSEISWVVSQVLSCFNFGINNGNSPDFGIQGSSCAIISEFK
jgi:surface protein